MKRVLKEMLIGVILLCIIPYIVAHWAARGAVDGGFQPVTVTVNVEASHD